MRSPIIAGMFLLAVAASCPLRAQTNTSTDEVAQLTRRVAQLEKQVQEISQFLNPLKGQQAIISSRRKALQTKVEQRFAQDRDKYSPEEVFDAEKLYQVINQKGGSPEAGASFQSMVKKYPGSDRTGCAALYIAQRSQGDDRVKYLKDCIEKYDDCIYGDGVQVGAYARFLLAKEYRSKGDDKQAAALTGEIKTKYANAIDHGGNLLVDAQGRD